MPNITRLHRLDRFNRLFELIRQRDAALAVQHRLNNIKTDQQSLRDDHQAFVTDAVKSLDRELGQGSTF